MPESWFRGLFDTALTTAIAPVDFLLCVGVSLALGLLLCAMTLWRSPFSRSLAVTLAILPAVVCVVIMMVNGNVGTGVAVAGAFNWCASAPPPAPPGKLGPFSWPWARASLPAWAIWATASCSPSSWVRP